MRPNMRAQKNHENETLAERKARRALGVRGKSSEMKVFEILAKWLLDDREFDYDRLLDSRSARTIVSSQVSDFLLFYKGKAATLEVKEIKDGLRLPRKSFPQHGRMARRERAGCIGFLLVHTKSTEQWWVVRISKMALGSASWRMNSKLGTSFESAQFALEFIKKQMVH